MPFSHHDLLPDEGGLTESGITMHDFASAVVSGLAFRKIRPAWRRRLRASKHRRALFAMLFGRAIRPFCGQSSSPTWRKCPSTLSKGHETRIQQ
jgi:hypothetical protein